MSKLSNKTLEILGKAAFLKAVPDKYDMRHLEIERVHLTNMYTVEEFDIAEVAILKIIKKMTCDLCEEADMFDAITGSLYLLDSIKLSPLGRQKYTIERLSRVENVLAETLNAAFNVIKFFETRKEKDFEDELYNTLFAKKDIDYVIDIFRSIY